MLLWLLIELIKDTVCGVKLLSQERIYEYLSWTRFQAEVLASLESQQPSIKNTCLL